MVLIFTGIAGLLFVEGLFVLENHKLPAHEGTSYSLLGLFEKQWGIAMSRGGHPVSFKTP
jgi:hypothetical protein